MFLSFSYNIIAIYFSSLYQNKFFVGKNFVGILGWSDTFANQKTKETVSCNKSLPRKLFIEYLDGSCIKENNT